MSRSITATTAFNRQWPNKTCMLAYSLFVLQLTVFRAIHDTWAGEERIEDLVPENLSKVKRFHVLLCSCSCSWRCPGIDLELPDRLVDRLTGMIPTLGSLLLLFINLFMCNNSFIRLF